MKLKELENIITNLEDVEVDAIETIEHDLFSRVDDYRKEAIKICIDNRIGFHNTNNNSFILLKECIVIRCPDCGELMKINSSMTGNGNGYFASYFCKKCDITGSITIPVGFLNFRFE